MATRDHMGNFRVHVVAQDPETLRLAIDIAMAGRKVAAWGTAREKGSDAEWLALYWSTPNTPVNQFPIALDVAGTVMLVSAWLGEHEPNGERPDIDGSVSHGFELIAEKSGWSYQQFRVRPIWAEHGK